MISKNTVKFLKSLQIKKYRDKENAFLVEGAKSVIEVINSHYVVRKVWITNDFYEKNTQILTTSSVNYEIVKESELSKTGSFNTNNAALALVDMPIGEETKVNMNDYTLALDNIRDPGNMGAMLRIADWYGIGQILCAPGSVDLYNPKVIAASMGSFCRVQVIYEDMPAIFVKFPKPVIGALMQGENVHRFDFPKAGYLLVGNESTGISQELIPLAAHQISIPRIGNAESLNAAVAAAVILDNIFREV